MNERVSAIMSHVTPISVLKWSSVIFVVVLQILVVIALILSMAGVFD